MHATGFDIIKRDSYFIVAHWMKLILRIMLFYQVADSNDFVSRLLTRWRHWKSCDITCINDVLHGGKLSILKRYFYLNVCLEAYDYIATSSDR